MGLALVTFYKELDIIELGNVFLKGGGVKFTGTLDLFIMRLVYAEFVIGSRLWLLVMAFFFYSLQKLYFLYLLVELFLLQGDESIKLELKQRSAPRFIKSSALFMTGLFMEDSDYEKKIKEPFGRLTAKVLMEKQPLNILGGKVNGVLILIERYYVRLLDQKLYVEKDNFSLLVEEFYILSDRKQALLLNIKDLVISPQGAILKDKGFVKYQFIRSVLYFCHYVLPVCLVYLFGRKRGFDVFMYLFKLFYLFELCLGLLALKEIEAVVRGELV